MKFKSGDKVVFKKEDVNHPSNYTRQFWGKNPQPGEVYTVSHVGEFNWSKKDLSLMLESIVKVNGSDEDQVCIPEIYGGWIPADFVELYKEKFVLFYSFNGILTNNYSIITDKTEDEIRARMSMLKIKTPLAWSIHRWEEFEKIIKQFEGGPNQLIEIPFEDAMSILRVGQLNEFEKFIEAEMEEFTDKCVPGVCRPGDHKCGK